MHCLPDSCSDCVNVSNFFKRQGLPSAVAAEDLFNQITEMEIEGRGREFEQHVVDVQQSEEYVRKIHGPAAKHQLLVDKEMTFDYFFEKAQKQRRRESKKDKEDYDDSDIDSEEESDDEDCD